MQQELRLKSKAAYQKSTPSEATYVSIFDEGATRRNEGRQVAHVTTPVAHASLAVSGVSFHDTLPRLPSCSAQPGHDCLCLGLPGCRGCLCRYRRRRYLTLGLAEGRGIDCLYVCMDVWMYGCMYSTLAFIEQGGRGAMSL